MGILYKKRNSMFRWRIYIESVSVRVETDGISAGGQPNIWLITIPIIIYTFRRNKSLFCNSRERNEGAYKNVLTVEQKKKEKTAYTVGIIYSLRGHYPVSKRNIIVQRAVRAQRDVKQRVAH